LALLTGLRIGRESLSSGTFDGVPFSYDARNTLSDIAIRLASSAPVLGLLATARDRGTAREHRAPATLTLATSHILVESLIDESATATNTDALHYLENLGEELNEIDRAGEIEMAEMTGAGVVGLSTTATRLSIV
jgi:hypothetical protein